MRRVLIALNTVLVVFVLSPAPAQAESDAEIADYFDDVYKYDMPAFLDCYEKDDRSDTCATQASRIICDVNAMHHIAGENGATGRFASDLADLTDTLNNTADYLHDLIDAGLAENPAQMRGAAQHNYCKSISSAVWP
jgi:hypothetical protein